MVFNKKGLSIVELIIAIFILGSVMVAFFEVAVFSYKILKENKNQIKAGYWAEEGMEAVRSIRDKTSWSDSLDGKIGLGEVDTDTIYYLIVSVNEWQLTTVNPGLLEAKFNRRVTFANVSRDPVTGDIEDVYNPANYDDNSKKVNLEINWQEGSQTKNLILVAYLTNS